MTDPEITDDTPLRLAKAIRMFFGPGSGFTPSSLRREHARGRLAIHRIAGKDCTTQRALREMVGRCQLEQKDRGYGSGKPSKADRGQPPATKVLGSSETDGTKKALDAALTIAQELSGHSPPTSPENTSRRRRKALVIPLRSQ